VYDPKTHKYSDAATSNTTGKIFYGDGAFNSTFDYFLFAAYHEMRHSRLVLSGKYKDVTLTDKFIAKEEYGVYWYGYKNQGLYRNHGMNFAEPFNDYGPTGGIFGYDVFFQPKWWHQIYRIPRLW